MENTSRKNNKKQNTGLKIKNISALNDNQKLFFKNNNNYQVISLLGSAGTGKSFLAMYSALKSIEQKEYDKLIIIRSAVPTRNIGFLPGSKKEKMEEYEGPYISICNELYERGDAYSILKQKNIVEFEPSSFLRGMTFDDCILLIDEAQNMDRNELYTILTRVGDNCKVYLCGDTKQDDLTSERYKESSGLSQMMRYLNMMDEYHFNITFTPQDIVRSGFVKKLIMLTQL